MDLQKLWEEYVAHGSEKARENLIINYLPLVRHIAGRLAVKMPYFMQQDDLESCGVIGLMEAVDKYDPALGVEFETFAYQRIRGAMIDELRKQSWIPRTIWQKQQAVKAAREQIRQKGNKITEEELAKSTGMSLEELRKILQQTSAGQVVSLDDEIYSDDGDATRRGDLIEDTNSLDPLEFIDEQEDMRMLVKAIEKLRERDKLVLSLYYQEGLTLKEIGAVLEVSESRVCQLHSRAVKRLREILEEMNR
ncbi:MAG: FliA/WhiG family RNA polymerase sigma factor [Desulfotomaculum sp.]|nr:FliA/WhiG family RNA polymerase sigma factor [Desulfotomaculum sp.]